MARGNIKEVSLSMSIIVLTTYVLKVMAMDLKCSFCNRLIQVESGWDRGFRELNPVQGNWFYTQTHDSQPQTQNQESSGPPTPHLRRSISEPSMNEAYKFHTRFQRIEHQDRESKTINPSSATPKKMVQVTNIWCGSESLNTRQNRAMAPEYNEGRLKQVHLEVKEGNTYLGLLQHACTNDEVAYLTGAMGVFNTFQLVKHEEKVMKLFLHATVGSPEGKAKGRREGFRRIYIRDIGSFYMSHLLLLQGWSPDIGSFYMIHLLLTTRMESR